MLPADSEYRSSEPPGICSQEDFSHDWHILLDKLDEDDQMELVFLVELARDKGYRIEV